LVVEAVVENRAVVVALVAVAFPETSRFPVEVRSPSIVDEAVEIKPPNVPRPDVVILVVVAQDVQVDLVPSLPRTNPPVVSPSILNLA
jgi:hypothetical protein